ncbi:MAG: helix-turn-helix domain-containing protein [Pseudomonadota bacterium]|nr:MAG: helix-turn-helix domain-containing protein [Pseudomonadota bacterium]
MAVMDFYSMTDKAIAEELGQRVRALRLRRNLTQQQLSEATALSLNTIKSLEAGKGKLWTLIAVLRELDALQELDSMVPAPTVSPLQLARRRGKPRQRASGTRAKAAPTDEAQ